MLTRFQPYTPLDMYRFLATEASVTLSESDKRDNLNTLRATATLRQSYNTTVSNQLKLVQVMRETSAADPLHDMLEQSLAANGEHVNALQDTLALVNQIQMEEADVAWGGLGGRRAAGH